MIECAHPFTNWKIIKGNRKTGIGRFRNKYRIENNFTNNLNVLESERFSFLFIGNW